MKTFGSYLLARRVAQELANERLKNFYVVLDSSGKYIVTDQRGLGNTTVVSPNGSRYYCRRVQKRIAGIA